MQRLRGGGKLSVQRQRERERGSQTGVARWLGLGLLGVVNTHVTTVEALGCPARVDTRHRLERGPGAPTALSPELGGDR